MPKPPPGSARACMPVTRPSTPARRMMLTALGEANEMRPVGRTRRTPSPARLVVENGSPVPASSRGPVRSVSSSSSMESICAVSIEELLETLRTGPLLDAGTGEPFSTTRRAGDGVLRVRPTGRISFASPNAVNIMRLAGVEGRVTGMQASALPGGGFGISPVLGGPGAVRVEVEVADRVLGYRSIALQAGALVLVEDLSEARRRELELRVKETTIREVHH